MTRAVMQTAAHANPRREHCFVFYSVGLSTPFLEALVDDLGQSLVDIAFACEDQLRAHDEQVVQGVEPLREIQSVLCKAVDYARRERTCLLFGLVK